MKAQNIDTFLKKFEIAMQELKYLHLLPMAKQLYKDHSGNEKIAAAYGTLLDHQARVDRFIFSKWFKRFKAKRVYLRIMKNNPKSIAGLNGLGRWYWHKSHPKAIWYYQKALDLAPDNAKAINNLANAYKAVGDDEEAKRLYELAVNTKNVNVGIFLNYFRLLENMGSIKSAKNWIHQAEQELDKLTESPSKQVARSQLEEIKQKIRD